MSDKRAKPQQMPGIDTKGWESWLFDNARYRKEWPAIANQIAGELHRLDGDFLDPDEEDEDQDTESMIVLGSDAPCRWERHSWETHHFMSVHFKFDCALHPALWRYLFERLPVLAATKERP